MSESVQKDDLNELITEFSALREKLVSQQEELASQVAEIKVLRSKVQSLEAEKSNAGQSQTLSSKLASATTSRRNLLKLGGAAAGLVALTSLNLVANRPHVILASDDDRNMTPLPPGNPAPNKPTVRPTSDGDIVHVSGSHAPTGPASHSTYFYDPSTTELAQNLFWVNNWTNTSVSLPASTRVALAATTSGVDTTNNTKIGIFAGCDNGYGLYSQGGQGHGIYTTASGSISDGISSYVTGSDGWAVHAVSIQSLGGYFWGGRAALRLGQSGADPRTRTDAHNVSELYVDSSNNLWYCVADGTPGTWRKVGGPSTAGALHFLTFNDRFVDTRPGSGNRGGVIGPVAAGSTATFTLAGATGRDGQVIPAGATGITGTLSILSPTASGLAKILPFGTSTSTGTASVSWSAGVSTNAVYVCALNSGKVIVFNGSAGTLNILIDVAAYYM